MKRLDHGRKGPAGPDEKSRERAARRSFLKVAGAALLGGALALSPMSSFGKGAGDSRTLTVNGMKLAKIELSASLAALEAQSRQYRNGNEIIAIKINNGIFRSTVTLDGVGQDGKIITAVHYEGRKLTSSGGIHLHSFANLVTQVTGQDPKKARLIVEFTKSGGEDVVNIFALPLDAYGNQIGKYRGGYLVVGATYYPEKNRIFAGTAIIYEPKPTIALADQ